MTDYRVDAGFRAIQQGPPLTADGRRALAALSKDEVRALWLRLARAQGVPHGEFLPKNPREGNAEVIVWKSALDQTINERGGTGVDTAISNAAVTCADSMVRKFAASAHNMSSVMAGGAPTSSP